MQRKHYVGSVAGIVGGYLVLRGAVAIFRGDVGWRNYWDAVVYAPFAIVIGLLLFVVLFKRAPSGGRRKRRIKDRSGFAWGKGQK
jgi:hypothetical protein